MQNLVVFIEPSEDDSNISAKAAMLFLNRFCIGEESACELSGVYYLKESSSKLARFAMHADRSEQLQADKIAKGKDITEYARC